MAYAIIRAMLITNVMEIGNNFDILLLNIIFTFNYQQKIRYKCFLQLFSDIFKRNREKFGDIGINRVLTIF